MTFGHHVLRNRYRFEGELELETALRLSSGRASEITDAPLMRDRAGRPFMPGSSLRGALRSELERILPEIHELKLRSCVLFTADDSEEACITASREKQEKVRAISEGEEEGQTREDREAKVATYLSGNLCDLCQLFGSPHYASRLVIEDGFPRSGNPRTAVRDGVGIDRDTGTARESVKFNYEVLEPEGGLRFTFRMQVENLNDTDRKLLKVLVFLLQEGFYVGGKRAAGLGRVRLVRNTLKATGFDGAEGLWKALAENRDPYGEPRDWQEVIGAQA
jgi:CRISPR-associated RAMP protein (TIGR02581 family)